MGIHRKRQHEKPRFPCKLCDKGFHNPSNLNDHIHSVHDRSRDFQCQHCDKNYAIKKYLLDHIKEIHFKSKISCELCKTKLARVINYKMHVKRVHKDLSEDEMTALLLRIKKIRPDYENMEFYYS